MSRTRRCIALIACCLAIQGCGGDPPGEVVVARAPTAGADTDAGSGSDVPAAGADADLHVASATAPTGRDAGIVVDVAGAVRRPGVYRMQPGARVHEAIQAAGGARRGAELGTLNRAAVLVDGQQVLVGQFGAAPSGSGAGAAGGPAALLNINSADAAALDALPGIGEVTAERIVASRDEAGPFASLDDLDRVSGIGPATIESLRSVATT